ncbi:MAG: TolC family protein [Desulfurivibrionaceae bacterium]
MPKYLCAILLAFNLLTALPLAAEPLRLGQAFELALDKDPKIRARRFQTMARQEQPRQAKAQLFPQISASSATTKTHYELSYLTQPVEETTFQYAVNLFQPLFRPELWNKLDYATLQAEASRVQLQIDEQKLAAELAKAYFDALLSRRGLEFARTRMEAQGQRREKLDGYLAQGLTTKMDALDARVEFDRARAEWLAEGKRLQVALLTLGHLTGLAEPELPAETPAIGRKADSAVVEKEELNAWRQGLAGSLEVRLAGIGLALAQTDMRIRRNERYPKLDARLSFSDSDSSESTTRRNDARAMLELNIPLYQGGYATSREEEARLSAAAAKEEVSFQIKTAAESLENYWMGYRLALDRIAAHAEARTSAALLVEATEKAHAAGLQDTVKVLEARARLAESEREMVRAQSEAVVAGIGLRMVTGDLNNEGLAALELMILGGS